MLSVELMTSTVEQCQRFLNLEPQVFKCVFLFVHTEAKYFLNYTENQANFDFSAKNGMKLKLLENVLSEVLLWQCF